MKNTVSTYFKEMGPAWIISAVACGPATLASVSIAGATYGYRLLWVVILSAVFGTTAQYLAARVGILEGQGIIAATEERLGKFWAWLLTIDALLATWLAAIVLMSALSGITSLISGIDSPYWGIMYGIVIGLFLVRKGYRKFETLCKILVIFVVLCFIFTLFMADLSVVGIAKGLLPNLPGGIDAALMMAAIMGGAVHITIIGMHTYNTNARNWTPRDLPLARFDTISSMGLAFGIYSVAIFLVAAAVLNPNGITIKKATDAAVLPAAAGPACAKDAKALIGKAMAMELGEELGLPSEDMQVMLDEYANYMDEMAELKADRAEAKQALEAAIEGDKGSNDILDLLDALVDLDEEIAALPSSYAEAYMSDLSGAQLAQIYLFLADFDQNIAGLMHAMMGAPCGGPSAGTCPAGAAPAEAAAPAQSPEDAALAAAKAWGEALIEQDMDAVMAAFADDFEHYEYGDKQGIADFIGQAVDMGYLEDLEVYTDDAEVEVDGDEYIVYPVELMGAFGSVTFELVFQDRGGKMLITTLDASGI